VYSVGQESDIAPHTQLRGTQDAQLGVLGPVALRRGIPDKAQQRPARKASKLAASVGVRVKGKDDFAAVADEGRLQQARRSPGSVGSQHGEISAAACVLHAIVLR
jgi:hypothetical protein